MIPLDIKDITKGFWTPDLPKDFDYNKVRLGPVIKIDYHEDKLISTLYQSCSDDLTHAGFYTLNQGTDQEKRIYKTEHQPSSADSYGPPHEFDDIGFIEGKVARYRKIEHETLGVVWELIPESVAEIK